MIELLGESINSLVKEHEDEFYPQTWFSREPFACKTWRGEYALPPFFLPTSQPVDDTKLLPAAVIVKAFLTGQLPNLWDSFIWTSDVDHNGDRVYVGMAGEYGGLQIHRHLRITERWVA